jgi:hypothetical protein
MKLGVPPADYKVWGWKKIIIFILILIGFLYIIGRLQVGTDDKPETQKRGSIGSSFIFLTALFLFEVVSEWFGWRL